MKPSIAFLLVALVACSPRARAEAGVRWGPGDVVR
jgi:hypothetical protein